MHLALATAAAAVLVLLAGVVARILDTPALATPLRLFALDIPLFCLAQAHRSILVGTGDFESRALVAAARWVSRLLLVILFVELGLAIKRASPFRTTFVIELANTDETIYIPTREAYRLGGYEVINSTLAPGGGELLVEAAPGALVDLYNEGREGRNKR